MAGRLGIENVPVIRGEINPFTSSDLNENTNAVYDPTIYDLKAQPFNNSYSFRKRVAGTNNWRVVGRPSQSFLNDYYYRVHLSTYAIDFGTVATPQTRQVEVWNAWPDTVASLSNISLSNPQGITVSGPATPYSLQPLQAATYSITVGTTGPAKVDVEALFDFSNVADPLPLLIEGTRAVKFEVVPEVPVGEDWEWLTDVQTATDGTEMRVSLRGEYPRVTQSFKAIFTTQSEINRFVNQLLVGVGRLWTAEYQYATQLTAPSASGAVTLNFDRTRTDIRVGEYALVVGAAGSALVEIATLETYGATLAAPLEFALETGALVVPGAGSFLANESSIDRHAVNYCGETNLNCKMIRYRDTLTRPGNTTVLPTFLGDVVCDKRPLANSLVADAVATGQELIDNQTGVLDLISNWDYSRVGGPREFKVDRVRDPAQMDYWKAVLGNARGQARKFWMPTYREDLTVTGAVGDATNSIFVQGTDYVNRAYTLLTHRYLEIETEGGIHRCSVQSATEVTGNTQIGFTPALPTGATWTQIKRISYLLPVRLAEDRASWKHYGLESLLSFSIRTAEP